MNLNRRSFFAWLLAPFVAKALPNVQHVGRAKPNPMLDKLNAYTMKHIVPRTTFDTIFPKSPIFMRLAGKPKPINGFHEWAEYGSAENFGINRNLKPRSLGMTTLIEESHPYIPGKGLAFPSCRHITTETLCAKCGLERDSFDHWGPGGML